MAIVVRPDLDLVIQLYKSALPDYDYLLRKLESQEKWLRFSPRLHELTVRFKCQNYSELYQGETRIQTALLRALFESDGEIETFLTDLNAKSESEMNQFLNKSVRKLLVIGRWMDKHQIHLDALDWSHDARILAEKQWNAIPADEQQRMIRFHQYTYSFCLASFHNYLALMVHGKKMTQLVEEAIAGSDRSYFLAVHIDKTIPDYIPYFKERYQRAKQEGDASFLEAMGNSIAKAHLNGRIRHRLLFILFALLEGTNWLDSLKHREILDICDQLEFDRYAQKIETENALTKRLIEYRQFQQANVLSMP